MKANMPSRSMLAWGAALLASNVITGLVTARVVRTRDFSTLNENCLLNWGGIDAEFRDKPTYSLPRDPAQLYRIHEISALAAIYPSNKEDADHKALALFCWGVAADSYHWKRKDVVVNPALWRAFLADGPKDLPVYQTLRRNLTDEGAGKGFIRGDTMFPVTPRLSE